MKDPTRLRHDPIGRSTGVDVVLRAARRPQPPAADDLARLAAAVDGLSRAPYVPAARRWMLGSATAAVVIAGLGTGVWAWRSSREPAPAPLVAASTRTETVRPAMRTPEPEVVTTVVEAPRAVAAAHAPARHVSKRHAPPTRATRPAPAEAQTADTLAREIALIDAGRSAMTAAPGRALAVLETHRREFPHGQLAAEREFLAVGALLAAHRTDDARRRAGELEARYPQSSYAARAARLLKAP